MPRLWKIMCRKTHFVILECFMLLEKKGWLVIQNSKAFIWVALALEADVTDWRKIYFLQIYSHLSRNWAQNESSGSLDSSYTLANEEIPFFYSRSTEFGSLLLQEITYSFVFSRHTEVRAWGGLVSHPQNISVCDWKLFQHSSFMKGRTEIPQPHLLLLQHRPLYFQPSPL